MPYGTENDRRIENQPETSESGAEKASSDEKKEANICFSQEEAAADQQADEAVVKEEKAESGEVNPENETQKESAEGVPVETQENARAVGEEKVFSEDVFGAFYTLADRFPEHDVAHDISSKAFRLFAAGKSGEITAIYEEYIAFQEACDFSPREKSPTASVDEAYPNDGAQDSEAKEAYSRSYSSFSGGMPPVDYGEALTARQMLIARQSGMSYREYAELLHSVPHGNGRKLLAHEVESPQNTIFHQTKKKKGTDL